eukprot:CAMPEP_0119105370 /NCGR_PEP_ID=MMETSP1180-20130426/3348_1 /TAXON_ID=3052 ORGANISM="Chlamydomonas cf sp, Strain CCMP681" /NCGR_SAMPLE_ID=MMETSP1180 /ASSEMBLY_ACC=CAM_ASM_000741 /LENGTH=290 /DNA_ID=CAMNT_0007090399 /DNA_START=67 /DNA_END=939 /DNA_ORIENTATION=-
MGPTTAISRTVVLNNGVSLPRIGLGTYQAQGDDVVKAVKAALQAGLRHIDTAVVYRNEEQVAQGIRESGVPRSEVFVTSKIAPFQQGTSGAQQACKEITQRLGGFPDMLLIHWPAARGQGVTSPMNAELRLETWRVLEDELKNGHVRAIGVSNYEIHHLQELLQHAVVKPAVNQVELHPRRINTELRDFCAKHAIVIEAYSPLGRGELISHPVVHSLAQQLGKSAAQVLLRWSLQHGLVVLPKSISPARIVEWSDEQLMSAEWGLGVAQMSALDALDDGWKYCWDPKDVV